MNAEDIKKEEERLLSENLTEDENKFPPLFVQARNLMKQAWLSGTDIIKGRSFLSTPEKASARWEICKACEFLNQNRCLKCGCFMEKKIHLESSQCPLNKWGDLQTPYAMKAPLTASVQNPNPPVLGEEVSMDAFSESDQTKIAEIATHAATNNTPFYFQAKGYKSYIDSEGTVKIFEASASMAPNQPVSSSMTVISGFSENEKVQFNALVQQFKNSESKTFNFMGTDFVIKIEGTKTIVGLKR